MCACTHSAKVWIMHAPPPLPPQGPCIEGLIRILWSKWGVIENYACVCERGGVDMYVLVWSPEVKKLFSFFRPLFTLKFETGFR